MIETSLYDYSESKQPSREKFQNYNPATTILQSPKMFEKKEKQIQHHMKKLCLKRTLTLV